jgi:hypothetical protein
MSLGGLWSRRHGSAEMRWDEVGVIAGNPPTEVECHDGIDTEKAR